MQTMMVDNQLSTTINEIACQLKMSQQAILKQAIDDYVKKLRLPT